MDVRTGLIATITALIGVAAGAILTVNILSRPIETDVITNVGTLDSAKKDAADARAEATHWQGEADRLARQLAMKAQKPITESVEPVEAVTEIAQQSTSPIDASMREELDEYRARDRERDERSEERRGQWAEWQTEMVDRRTDMFTGLIERVDDPVEQQRWADIEQQMTFARELGQQMRSAETDEERLAVREEMGENYQSMQDNLKVQQNAVLKRALDEQGINDSEQVKLIQKAVRSSLSDRAFQMSGSDGRGWGGGGMTRGGMTRGGMTRGGMTRGGGPGRGGPGRNGPQGR